MATTLAFIPLSKVRQNRSKMNLRGVNQSAEAFIQLTSSIRDQGVLNPINVRERLSEDDDKQYDIIDGLQRYTASVEAGTGVKGSFVQVKQADGTEKPEGVIPAQILEKDDVDLLVAQVIANAQKIETKQGEYAKQLIRILDTDPTMTRAMLASKLNTSTAWLDKILSLSNLTDQARQILDEGRMPVTNAFLLAKMPPDEQPLWIDRAQTLPASEFSGPATNRIKEIQSLHKKGLEAGSESFIASPSYRKRADVVGEIDSGKSVNELIRQLNLLEGLPKNASGLADAAAKGAKLALQWALNIDPISVEAQQKKWEDKRDATAKLKETQTLERTEKKAAEAAKKAAEAKAAADAAKAAVEAKNLQPA